MVVVRIVQQWVDGHIMYWHWSDVFVFVLCYQREANLQPPQLRF